MVEEAWKLVVGEQHYEVSNLGRVRSLDRRVHNYLKRGRVLKACPRYSRYGRLVRMDVNINLGNTRKVHHLVLDAFIGPRPPGMEGCHNDGDPSHNALTNLRWDTHEGNMADRALHGTGFELFPPPIHMGEKHHNATLTTAEVQFIRLQPPGDAGILAVRYGVSRKTIYRIKRGETRATE